MNETLSGPNQACTEDAADIPGHVRRHLGAELQAYFSLPAGSELPTRLAHLVSRFDTSVPVRAFTDTDTFRDDLVRSVSALRGFAFSLAGDATRADDLVQETMVKAWSNRHRFQPGTNINAWLFTILRNQFYSDMRKARREVEDVDGGHAAKLTALPDQEGVVNLGRLWERLERIPEIHRTALLMVGAEGYTYEEAAELLQCKVGTVKSRVSRARACLSEALGLGRSDTPDAFA